MNVPPHYDILAHELSRWIDSFYSRGDSIPHTQRTSIIHVMLVDSFFKIEAESFKKQVSESNRPRQSPPSTILT